MWKRLSNNITTSHLVMGIGCLETTFTNNFEWSKKKRPSEPYFYTYPLLTIPVLLLWSLQNLQNINLMSDNNMSVVKHPLHPFVWCLLPNKSFCSTISFLYLSSESRHSGSFLSITPLKKKAKITLFLQYWQIMTSVLVYATVKGFFGDELAFLGSFTIPECIDDVDFSRYI